jgi:hypothetical protein
MNITKKQAAEQARERREKTFSAVCKHHGETLHYANPTRQDCVACSTEKYAKRTGTPEARKAYNDYYRERTRTNEHRRGQQRATSAAQSWSASTGGPTPVYSASEQETLNAFYAAMPKGHHGDHLTPKKAKDFRGKRVASGLHNRSNLQSVPARLNLKKSTYFDPDNFRDQRPANALPGGAWDPELTEQEWSRVELMVRRYGEDRAAAVAAIQAQIARSYEAFCA